MQTSDTSIKTPVMHYVIVTEKMVWQFYYDEFGSKHFQELLGDDAKKFIESLSVQAKRSEA